VSDATTRVDVDDIMSSRRITFGITGPTEADAISEFEDMGVESLWVGGHIASRNPSPECMVYLSVVAARSTVPVGTSILLLPLYPPAMVAKQVADLDNAVGGRIILGIGVGGEYPKEFEAIGVSIKERGARANEAIPLIRELWSAEPVTHDGRFFPMEEVKIHPAPPRRGGPPIVVSGRQEPAMRRAALLGDGWMPYMYSARRYKESVGRIHDLAGDEARSLDGFAWMSYIPVCIDDDPVAAQQDGAAFLGGTYRQDFEEMIKHIGAVGTAEDVADRLCQYVEAGARHFIFLPTRREALVEQTGRLIEEVMPTVRAALGSA
jgi:alkanesulfonate monooxygenase SsuD/methylene tetrahydromethanopterin reductase-like flavin-dependent oxidoreductase (luciferase family)